MTELIRAHITHGKEIVRRTLHTMTPTQIADGMRAFTHPPDGTVVGCFVTEAGMWQDQERGLGVAWMSWCYEVSPHSALAGWATYSAAHGDLNAWLHGECLRELAERGAAQEPQVPVREEATC